MTREPVRVMGKGRRLDRHWEKGCIHEYQASEETETIKCHIVDNNIEAGGEGSKEECHGPVGICRSFQGEGGQH